MKVENQISKEAMIATYSKTIRDKALVHYETYISNPRGTPESKKSELLVVRRQYICSIRTTLVDAFAASGRRSSMRLQHQETLVNTFAASGRRSSIPLQHQCDARQYLYSIRAKLVNAFPTSYDARQYFSSIKTTLYSR
ncbi:hypothetical protein SK128_009660 [Halocaridina rubra]|uniref:Uncharacterized protein n=1 Tax=Halocaridina rubra TaxID=373956 RepID=A0AAN8WYI9_HALRR